MVDSDTGDPLSDHVDTIIHPGHGTEAIGEVKEDILTLSRVWYPFVSSSHCCC